MNIVHQLTWGRGVTVTLLEEPLQMYKDNCPFLGVKMKFATCEGCQVKKMLELKGDACPFYKEASHQYIMFPAKRYQE